MRMGMRAHKDRPVRMQVLVVWIRMGVGMFVETGFVSMDVMVIFETHQQGAQQHQRQPSEEKPVRFLVQKDK